MDLMKGLYELRGEAEDKEGRGVERRREGGGGGVVTRVKREERREKGGQGITLHLLVTPVGLHSLSNMPPAPSPRRVDTRTLQFMPPFTH